MKILQKISWKFRKIHITISPLIIYINSNWDGWGFDILNTSHNLWEGSLLKIVWNLPNGAEKKLSISGDLLFLRTILLRELSNLDDMKLWGSSFSKWNQFKFWALKLIFK